MPNQLVWGRAAAIGTFSMTAVTVVLAAYSLWKFPSGTSVPIHFGTHGPDRFAPARIAFSIAPIVCVLTSAIQAGLLIYFPATGSNGLADRVRAIAVVVCGPFLLSEVMIVAGAFRSLK
jgi:hypothetical protein